MKYSGVKELDMGAPYSTDSGKKMLIRKGGLWGERGMGRKRRRGAKNDKAIDKWDEHIQVVNLVIVLEWFYFFLQF